jgi:DNA repair protein RadC
MKTWMHPGGKLIELGPEALNDEELLAILIGTGYKGRTAQDIAKELLDNYYSIAGLLGKTHSDLSGIKGFKKGKITKIAAAFEITKRIFGGNKWELPNQRLLRLELSGLTDAEVLSVIIGSGYGDKTSEELSIELLNKYKSISGMMGKKLSDMAMIKGLGDVKVVRIAAAFEVARRVARALEKE